MQHPILLRPHVTKMRDIGRGNVTPYFGLPKHRYAVRRIGYITFNWDSFHSCAWFFSFHSQFSYEPERFCWSDAISWFRQWSRLHPHRTTIGYFLANVASMSKDTALRIWRIVHCSTRNGKRRWRRSNEKSRIRSLVWAWITLCRLMRSSICCAAPFFKMLTLTASLPARARNSFNASRTSRAESACCFWNTILRQYFVLWVSPIRNLTIAFNRYCKPPASSTATQNSWRTVRAAIARINSLRTLLLCSWTANYEIDEFGPLEFWLSTINKPGINSVNSVSTSDAIARAWSCALLNSTRTSSSKMKWRNTAHVSFKTCTKAWAIELEMVK